MTSLTKRKIDAAKPRDGGDYRLWDDSPRGLGIRIKPSGVKTFFVQYRSPVNQKKVRNTVGQYGVLTLEEARTEARKLLGAVAKGADPQIEKKQAQAKAKATALTMRVFCDDYLVAANEGRVTYRGRPKKPSTLTIDAGRIKRHIVPLLGDKLVRDISKEDVLAFMHAVQSGKTATVEKTKPRGVARVKGGAGTARRTLGLLGSIFSFAVRQGIREANPVTGIERPADGRRNKILSPDEYGRLARALEEMEGEGANATAVGAIRVLALSGCRKGEILALKRGEIDTHRQCLDFADSKTGQQLRPIGAAALAVLTSTYADDGDAYVFPATRGSGHMVGVKLFLAACQRAGLHGVTLHTLRHSYASVALELEYSEMTIAGLLGHRSHSITSRYSHHVDRALVEAANRVSGLIAERMELPSKLKAEPIETSINHG